MQHIRYRNKGWRSVVYHKSTFLLVSFDFPSWVISGQHPLGLKKKVWNTIHYKHNTFSLHIVHAYLPTKVLLNCTCVLVLLLLKSCRKVKQSNDGPNCTHQNITPKINTHPRIALLWGYDNFAQSPTSFRDVDLFVESVLGWSSGMLRTQSGWRTIAVKIHFILKSKYRIHLQLKDFHSATYMFTSELHGSHQ